MVVFSQKGYDAATLKEIAELVGVTPALLYSYFPSKRESLLAVVIERGTVAADASILTSDEDITNPRERLNRWGLDLVQRLNAAANWPAFRIMVVEGMLDEGVSSVLNVALERLKVPVVEYISRQIALGRFRRTDPDVMAEIIVQFLTQSVLRWWRHEETGA